MRLFRIVFATLLMGILFVGPAHAATYVISLNSGNVSSVTSSSEALAANIDLATTSLLTTVGNNVGVVNTTISGSYTMPVGLTLGVDDYLYVGVDSAASFTLNTPKFGFTWASMDGYNMLTLADAAGYKYEISGTTLMNLLNMSRGNQADVLFVGLSGVITSALFESSSAAFEMANFSVVPLPAAGILFSSGFLGLCGFRVRRKNVRT
ncbi:MAG: hypothetical protein PHE27_07240 [Alphaproteobacteria bacterium]|nr:hypothetical protein [Alphaproteobacteria bacterium]